VAVVHDDDRTARHIDRATAQADEGDEDELSHVGSTRRRTPAFSAHGRSTLNGSQPPLVVPTMRGWALLGIFVTTVAEAKGGHGSGHGGHGHGHAHGYGGTGGGRPAAAGGRTQRFSSNAEPSFVLPRDWEKTIADLRAAAPPSPPSTFHLPSTAESLAAIADHAFDRQRVIDEKLRELWQSPDHATMFRAIRDELGVRPEIRDDVERFVRDNGTVQEVDAVLAAPSP
jgi:hypothetical protein